MTNIVIVGAGFGGLRAALMIGKKIKKLKLEDRYEVILIDRSHYHTYTPTLYEVATTAQETANYLDLKSIVTFHVQELIAGLPISFVNGEITHLDIANGDVHCVCSGPQSPIQELKFDYLVLAPGSEPHYFDIPGLKENSLVLKGFLDAVRIRDRIAELRGSDNKSLHIVIGGGGSTGVELAGEIKVAERAAKIQIVEAAPSVLSVFGPSIVRRATKRLQNLGIEIVSNESISKVRKDKIILNSGKELQYDLLIWTGGVRGARLIETLPLKIEKRGRVEVSGGEMECLPQTPDLQLYGKIYALGDAVCFYDPKTGKSIPGVARAAMSQANIVAKNVLADIMERENLTRQVRRYAYKPWDYPYVIPIGGKYAIAKIGPFVISGFCGWALKNIVELNYLIAIMSLSRAFKIWLKGLRIFIQNDRLL